MAASIVTIEHDLESQFHHSLYTDAAMEVDGDSAHQEPEPLSINVLPEDLIAEIISKLQDPRDLAKVALVSHLFRRNCYYVKVVRHVCKLKNIQTAPGELLTQPISPRFKDIFLGVIKKLRCVESLSFEIEDDQRANRFKGDVLEKHSLWLSEGPYLERWLPQVGETLRSLTLIDYGQQAIFQTTPLLQLLSVHCKHLRELELRNMFLSTKDCSKFNSLEKLSLRCVKLMDNGLEELNECMPKLETVTLVTVVGLRRAFFNSKLLKVLCLGLNTRVATVRLDVPELHKLQLKMACPDELRVRAGKLKALALSMNKRSDAIIDFEGVKQLKELLMGASEISTLHQLSSVNRSLERVFLDVPCLHFDDVGGFKGVRSSLPESLPSMEAIRTCCSTLQVLSVGPGLWYSLEQDMSKHIGITYPKWPSMKRLILHLVVEDMELSYGLLTTLVQAMSDTLVSLEVYVHEDSKVAAEDFLQIEHHFPSVKVKTARWKKGLNFECFSA